MKNISFLFTLVVGMLLFVGCPAQRQNNTPTQQKMSHQQDSLDLIAQANQKRIAQMPIQELFAKLSVESSQNREPFNSSAFIELSRRKEVTADTILRAINTSDRASLLSLLLLRVKDTVMYKNVDVKKRTAILLDALKKSETFNLWGLPHLNLEAASNALIECGTTALSELRPLLKDCRKINFYGDEEYLEFKKYNYRFCDFVLFYYKTIQNDKFIMPEKQEERDLLIRQIK